MATSFPMLVILANFGDSFPTVKEEFQVMLLLGNDFFYFLLSANTTLPAHFRNIGYVRELLQSMRNAFLRALRSEQAPFSDWSIFSKCRVFVANFFRYNRFW